MRGEIKKGSKCSSSGGTSRSKDKKALLSSEAVFYVPQSSDAAASAPSSAASGSKTAASRARGRGTAAGAPAPAMSSSDSDADSDNGASSRAGSSSGAIKETVFDVSMLSEAVERLSDQRPSARQAALQALLAMLRGAAADHTVLSLQESYLDSTSAAVARILQRAASSVGAGVEETLLALEVLCLLGLVVGPQEDAFYARFQPLLLRGLEADEEEVQVAALFSLCFLSFVCSDGHSSGVALMDLCESIICGEAGGGSAGEGASGSGSGGSGGSRGSNGGGDGTFDGSHSHSQGQSQSQSHSRSSAADATTCAAPLVLPCGVDCGDELTVQAVESWALLSVALGDVELTDRSQERWGSEGLGGGEAGGGGLVVAARQPSLLPCRLYVDLSRAC